MTPNTSVLSGHGRFVCFDMESRGLLPDLKLGCLADMHVIVIKDVLSGEAFTFFDAYEQRTEPRVWLEAEGEQDGTLSEGLKFLMEAESLVQQNGTGYDFLAFEKVAPELWKLNYMEKRGKKREHVDTFPNKVMDTYVMSCTLNPERKVPVQAYC